MAKVEGIGKGWVGKGGSRGGRWEGGGREKGRVHTHTHAEGSCSPSAHTHVLLTSTIRFV